MESTPSDGVVGSATRPGSLSVPARERGMPRFGDWLDDEDAEAIAAYLLSRRAALLLVQAVLRGRAQTLLVVAQTGVFLLVIVASIEPLSVVPANVYGYASMVAYSLHEPSEAGATAGEAGTGPLQNLVSASFENPLVLLIASMVVGAVFGYVSGQVAKALTKKAEEAEEA